MIRADSVLLMLTGLLELWGLLLIVRGLWGDRAGGRERCPACGEGVGKKARRCESCGYENSRGRDFRSPRRYWWMVIAGAVTLLAPPVFLVGIAVRAAYTESDPERSFALWGMPAAGILAYGLALLGRGIYGQNPRGTRRCPKCWYDMGGAPGLVCPECGHDAKDLSNLLKRRRRARLVWIGAALALLGVIGFVTPLVQVRGWQTLVPSVVMIAGLEYLPDSVLGTGPPRPGTYSNDTLAHRLRFETFRPPERRWLVSKCLAILRASHNRALLDRASEFVRDRPDFADTVVLRLLGALNAPLGPERDTELAAAGGFLAWIRPEPSAPSRDAITAATDRLLDVVTKEPPVAANIATLLLGWSDRDPDALLRILLGSIDPKDAVRCDATLGALIHLARAHAPVREVLTRMLDSSDRNERITALLALYGDRPPFGCNVLIRPGSAPPIAQDEDVTIRVGLIFHALNCLWTWGSMSGFEITSKNGTPRPEVTRRFYSDLFGIYVPLLIQDLNASEVGRRLRAVKHMTRIAMQRDLDLDLGAAVPRLKALADDPDQQICEAARGALKEIEKN